MITKEQKINKYCCLYVSDFHLEMIILPYLKKKMNNSKILIYTQKNLLESIKILLEKTNLNLEYKKKILSIKCWSNEKIDEIYNENIKEYTIIVNGDKKYITNINKRIKMINADVINIVDCYDINNIDIKSQDINGKYKGILNRESI